MGPMIRGVDLGIVVEEVTKTYGDRTVVDSLSFEARPGRVTGFLGPNGSGKSTTMKIMLDLAEADRGSVTVAGTRYRDLPQPTAVVGALLEANAFHPGRSGRNHLRILADAAGVLAGRDGLQAVAGGRQLWFSELGLLAWLSRRRAERQIDAPRLQLVGNVPRIGDGARQPIQLRHDKRVPFAHGGEGLIQTGTGSVRTGQPVVGIDPIR